MHKTTSFAITAARNLAATAIIATLAGCGGGSSGDSSSSTYASGSSSSTSSCDYADLISASERAQANACGVQVSTSYAQADSGLQQVIAACRQGHKTTADNYYATTYQQMVSYARSVSKSLSCGTTTGPTLPASNATHYNFCAKSYTNSSYQLAYRGVCTGPYTANDSSCGSGSDGYGNSYSSYSLVGQYASRSECQSAGQRWLDSR
ncbi:MAG TPA: hypothetical protein VEC06_02595 [Paucimonas sp.]|nr:hypothetical protein [Paucimonas sp.]